MVVLPVPDGQVGNKTKHRTRSLIQFADRFCPVFLCASVQIKRMSGNVGAKQLLFLFQLLPAVRKNRKREIDGTYRIPLRAKNLI